jgi:hypothetical protein
MPRTKMGYERIKALHESGNHDRCKFGCCPENPAPPQEAEFSQGYRDASRELASRLGRADPRVAVAEDTRAYLDTHPNLPGLVLADLEGNTMMIEDLSGEEPSFLDMIKVKAARRLLDECQSGVYHDDECLWS